MSAPWFVVKYVPDLYRREPRNVGVVLLDGDRGLARFLGQDPLSDEVDADRVRSVVPETRTYRSWVEYFLYHVHAGTWSRVRESLSRRAMDNFYVEEGGSWQLDNDDPHRLLGELYDSLVAEPPAPLQRSATPHLAALVNQVFIAAGVASRIESRPAFEIDVTGLRGRVHSKVRFDYLYANGHVTVMERMRLAPERPGDNLQSIDSFLYRAEHVTAAHPHINSYIALYQVTGAAPGEGHEEVDRELRLLEAYADTVDVSDIPTAAQELRGTLAGGQ